MINCNTFGTKWRSASCHTSNCNIFRGEQDAIKVNILIVAHRLNILCKRSGVSNGVITISATLTSCMQLPTCTFIYRNLSTQKTCQRIVSTSIQLTFQCGCLAIEVLSLEVPRHWLSEVRSVKLLGSDKSGHNKHSDRPTVKNTGHDDHGIGWTCWMLPQLECLRH